MINLMQKQNTTKALAFCWSLGLSLWSLSACTSSVPVPRNGDAKQEQPRVIDSAKMPLPAPRKNLLLSGAAAAWVKENKLQVSPECSAELKAEPVVNIACGLLWSQDASLSYGSKDKNSIRAADCFAFAISRLAEVQTVRSDDERLRFLKNSEADVNSSEAVIRRAERRYDIARFEWARIQLALGKAQQTLATLEFLSKFYQQEPEVWGGLGVALLGVGRLNLAIVPLAKAVKLEPERASRWDNLGTAQFLVGDTQQAIASYRGALSRDSLSAQIRADLGAALLISGELNEGIAHLREAVRREPNNGTYLSNLAYALYIKGELSEARVLIQEATQLAPQDVSTWLNQVTIFAASGDLDSAQKSLLKAESLGSTDPRVSKARADLDQVMNLRQ